MPVEPPRPQLRPRPSAGRIVLPRRAPAVDRVTDPDPGSAAGRVLPVAAAGAAVAMTVAGTGDVVLAGALAGLAAGGPVAVSSGVLAGLAVMVRWGSPSLGALGGAQAVFGIAGAVGEPVAVAATWCAAGALVLAGAAGTAPRRTAGALACGVLAAAVVAGPAGRSGLGVRLGATVAVVAVAVATTRLPARSVAVSALLAAAGALALAVAS